LFQNEVRKIAEKNLFQSESRLKEAQAIAHVGNFEVDLVNDLEIWSDEMYKIYGINKKEVTPSKELFLSFIHPDDLDNMTESVNETFKTIHGTTSNFKFIHHDGSVRYGYSETKIEFDKNNKPIRLFGILQDVTESKLGDIERIKMVSDLMVRNTDLEQFAYIISHNLRAPVANIIGASSVLNDTDVTDEDKEILNKAINTSVMKLDDVVKDLNHILQVKSSINSTKEIVYFSELVDNIKSSIKDPQENNISIAHDFLEMDEFFTIKPYLYSIFYNLISNSVKYCKRDIPCSIEIKSQLINGKLQLTFKDNGMGIDLEKNRNQLFGLYRRFHPGIEGKGMGLYMVKTQVETLGGKINIQSIVDKGTKFIIEFEV
jgi:PAS domain S-box-containing protein